MPHRALLIEVCLLAGRYHGARDWPPAPFRLFQALVAGAYGGRWRAESDDDKDSAFRWLEGLAAPHIAAPATIHSRATTYFVPNNDIDAVEGDPRRVSEIRSGKLVRPILLTIDAPCLYAWPFDEGEEHARRLCDLAERLHTLGFGIDAAFARAEVCDWSKAEARLTCHPGAVSRPGKPGDPEADPLCPIKGSLDSLKSRYASGANRFDHKREGRVSVTLFNQPPKALARAMAYGREPVRLLFELRSPADSASFHPIAQEQACKVAILVRDLAARRLTAMLPQRAAEIDRLVVGRKAGAADTARRVRIVPLPSIGHRHASPSIRRVLVEIPPDCPFPRNQLAVALGGQTLDRVDARTGEVTEDVILVPAEDETMLGHYGIGHRASRRWHSITPVVLPEPRPKGRLTGGARMATDQKAAAAVADALRHAGQVWRDVTIRVQQEPFHRQGARADAFDGDRFTGRLQHVEISFPAPIDGPLVIGDGRWLGLGMMAPLREGPSPMHVFAIDPAEAPPFAQRELLTRAIRRAVMARVDPVWRGDRRDRRNEPLPLYFTGHDTEGRAARPGHHEHLFFLADDADGDGLIDRLAVVSPHCADHSVTENKGYLDTLDRALAGLTILRAGRAGAPTLSPSPVAGEDDPLFGRATSWVSRTSYNPTRHPKRVSIAESVATDLLLECDRRGLPRPEVDILDVSIGPRDGITARARLRFKTAVEGPLLLGRGSHFGAGMFAIER
jgi:CRISPR-associated protein Csb2